MNSVYRPDLDSDPLQRKNCGAIAYVPVRNAGLNRQNCHGKAFSAKISRTQALLKLLSKFRPIAPRGLSKRTMTWLENEHIPQWGSAPGKFAAKRQRRRT